jgi:uncharacterized protein YidB (DUF937 family)
MGLLDGLIGAAGPLLGGEGQRGSPLLGSLLGMLGQSGGLAGLVQAFEQAGLGHVARSWVGTGQNAPVSPQQVQQALGPQVQQLAQQHGMAPEAVSSTLAQLLPGVVDHLTPGGQLPSGAGLEQGLSALRSRLGI